MPAFNPQKTTRLPASLAEELGVPNQPKRQFHRRDRNRGNQHKKEGKASGSGRFNQDRRINHDQQRQPRNNSKPRPSEPDYKEPRCSKENKSKPQLKVIGRPASSKRKSPSPEPPKRQRMNPITGEMESTIPSSSKSKTSALEKLLNKTESTSSGEPVKKKSRKQMSQAEKQEEEEIKWLEYHIRKCQGEDTVKDGLDEFLDDLDRFQVGMFESGHDDDEEGSSQEESDEEDDLFADWEDPENLHFDSNDDDDFSNWDAAMASTDEGAADNTDKADSQEQSDDDEMASQAEEESKDPKPAPAALPLPATGRYIPPALCAKMAAATSSSTIEPSVTQQKLRRQAQGLLNRMGDGNIDSIITEFESLYRSYSRAEVTSTVTQILLDTITSRSNLIDTFVILHAAFVASLHKVVGVEFAAYFVHKLVEDLTKWYSTLRKQKSDVEDVGKECLNLTVLACELYNLQVIACPLIYDLIRMFLDSGKMIETDVELLLKIVRASGPQLRHDDPSSLKAIIALTQENVSFTGGSVSTRSKFMLERLSHLKNNTSKADQTTPAAQLLVRMKKYLGGMGKKRTVRSYEPLRIGLKDLQDADKKGKWWLVGAAWAGQTDQEDATDLTKMTPMKAKSSESDHVALLALARKQGMNTDARRNVFITLLSSEDYQDAAHKLLTLKLNEVQRREIIRVLLHCLGSEKTFNPYYVLIGQQVCQDSHTMKITLQYCLWDFMREMGEVEVGGRSISASEGTKAKLDPRRIGNMARAIGWWMTKGSLSLNAFKTLDFTALRKAGTGFLQQTLVYLLLSTQASSPTSILAKSASFNEKKLQPIVSKGLAGGNMNLCRGLLVFVKTKLTRKQLVKVVGGNEERLIARLEAGVDALQRFIENVSNFAPQDHDDDDL